jgi:hypothetical protein
MTTLGCACPSTSALRAFAQDDNIRMRLPFDFGGARLCSG